MPPPSLHGRRLNRIVRTGPYYGRPGLTRNDVFSWRLEQLAEEMHELTHDDADNTNYTSGILQQFSEILPVRSRRPTGGHWPMVRDEWEVNWVSNFIQRAHRWLARARQSIRLNLSDIRSRSYAAQKHKLMLPFSRR